MSDLLASHHQMERVSKNWRLTIIVFFVKFDYFKPPKQPNNSDFGLLLKWNFQLLWFLFSTIVFIVVFCCYYQVEELLKPLHLSVANYDRIVNMMEENMNDGLSEKADISADIKMYITYVRTLPDGSGESFFHNEFKFFKKMCLINLSCFHF